MHASATPEVALRAVGRYRVFGELASGGMATVHLGHMEGDAGFSRVVAIKRMKPEIARQPEFVTMFRDEAAIAARVQHANVVATLDVVDEGDELFIVMEYVRGLALKQLMQLTFDRGERIPVDIALSIVGGALEGLHAAHNVRGDGDQLLHLVHRDVSPHNILVGRDGVAKIVDFGVAKATSRMHQTANNEVKGKLTYMAPERITSKDIDRRVDVFAAGVVLWEALAGRKRYDGESVQEIAAKLLTTEAPPLADERSDVPTELDAVIRRATAISPDDRYATAEAMLTDLERIGSFATKRAVSAWVEETGRDLLREHEELIRAPISGERAPESAPGRAGKLRDSAPGRSDTPDSGITLVDEPSSDSEPPLKTEPTRIIPELAREPVVRSLPVSPVRPVVVATVPMRAVEPTQVMKAIATTAPAPRAAAAPHAASEGDEDLETRLIRHPTAADEDLETRLIRHPTAADEDLETRLIRRDSMPDTRLETRLIRPDPTAATRSKHTTIVIWLVVLLLVLVVTVLLLRASTP
jgi:eukaryotic-like serine/threonine-protein kinase